MPALLGAAACAQILGDDGVILTPVTGGLCAQGELECQGEALRECREDGLGFRTAEVCSTPELCCSEIGPSCPQTGCLEPACAPGDFRCQGAELLTCNEAQTGWDRIDVCATAAQCNASRGRCTEQPCVSTVGSNELQCNGALVEACTPGGWQPRETCDSHALCNDEPPGSCTASGCEGAIATGTQARRCANEDLLRCNDHRTGFVHVETCATPANCITELGRCVEPACIPGTHRCDGELLRRCDSNRTRYGQVDEVCASPSHCNASEGRCQPEACTPGQHQCSGSDLMRCDPERNWELVTSCPRSTRCDAAAAACTPRTCQSGDHRCDDNVLSRCNAAGTGWVPVHECATRELCDPFAKRCDAPVCELGQRRCSRDGKLQICSPGRERWIDERDCRAEAMPPLDPQDLVIAGLCDAVAGTCLPQPTCQLGTLRCNGQFLEQCEGNTWRPRERCATPGLCDPSGSGRCIAPTCEPRQYRCVTPEGAVVEQSRDEPAPGLLLQACNDAGTAFEPVGDCGEGYCDALHGQCDVCPPFRMLCTGDTLERCSADGQEREFERRCPSGCGTAADAGALGQPTCLDTGMATETQK